jgi:NodT family efflux transporter outer membrane factor (OMF) lipoprotein
MAAKQRRLSSVALAALLMAGCTVGPKYHPPVTSPPAAVNYKESPLNFQDANGWKVASPNDAMLRGKWWQVFNDAELNALEEQLNINNQNIKQFFQDFMQARAIAAQARAQYWPTVTANPAWTRQRSSGTLTNSTQANPGRTSTFISFPLDVSWVPDFWGKIRNQVRANQYSAQISEADLETERLTEQASLAQFYFEVRGQDALKKILDDVVASDQKALDIAQGMYDTGVGDYISVVQARSALQSAQAAAINVGVARAQFEHAIAVLLAKIPTEFSLPVRPMLIAPPPIPVGVPSQLLERRPDIAAVERTLARDNATIGIGYGAFFPNIALSATGGFSSSAFSSLFEAPSRIFSIGPAISQTIFNGGLYRAQLHQFAAIYNADLAAYRQTVLTAFQQVEDNLSAVRILSQEIERQQAAVKSAQEFFTLSLGRYQTGIDPYLNVLTAQTTLLADQQTLVTLQIQQMVSAVNLVQALGGGWDRSQLPTPSQVSQKVPASEYKPQH